MTDTAPVKVSDWTKKQLEQIREIEGHTSIDSVIKSLLMFRSIGIGYFMKTDANPAGMLFKKQNDENFEKKYEDITDEVYKEMFNDEKGMIETINWIRETDPDMAEQMEALRKLYSSDSRQFIDDLKKRGFTIEIKRFDWCPTCKLGRNNFGIVATSKFISKPKITMTEPKKETTEPEPKKEDEKHV